MAQRTRANYKTTKNLAFATNGTGAITGTTERDIHEDIADSVLFWEDVDSSSTIPDIDLVFHEQTDFLGVTSELGFTTAQTGSGAGSIISTYGVDSTENCFGVLSLVTGTTNTGSARMYKSGGGGSDNIKFGLGHTLAIKARLATQNLSDGTDTYSVTFGFGEQLTSKDQQNGAYFTYTHGTNSGKWECVTANGGTRTTEDSGVAAATTYKIFEIIVNSAGTSVQFYIDGALVKTITTNIPTANFTAILFNIIKSAGTTSRAVCLDYYHLVSTRTTAR